MNARCPTCETVFRVDPAKVPPGGVRARCSVCGGVFFVGRPAAVGPAAGAAPVAPAIRPAAPPPSAPATMPPPGLTPPTRMPSAPVVAPPGGAPGAPGPVAPVRGASAPAPPASAPAARKVVNPFLAQDPATKARRLARALISDLVVYHPAKRADGLRDGTLKLLFEDEIRKCWEEYTEQVGMDMATSTPYFTEALNEILADGRAVFS